MILASSFTLGAAYQPMFFFVMQHMSRFQYQQVNNARVIKLEPCTFM